MHWKVIGTLWEKVRVGWSERITLKHVYYQVWNRSPAQVGCMRQVLWAGALGWPRRMGWGGRRKGRSGWGTHVNPWLSHVNVWQKPLQYCKVISLQLIKINEEGKNKSNSLLFWPSENFTTRKGGRILSILASVPFTGEWKERESEEGLWIPLKTIHIEKAQESLPFISSSNW